MNALALLKQQHEQTTTALEKIHDTGGSPTQLKQLADELVAHMVIEEHIFYPRVKDLMEERFDESFEEHAVARFELARLLQAKPSEVCLRALVLKELLEHHIDEEERDLFPEVESVLEEEELELLGLKMRAAFDVAVAKGLEQFLEPPPSFPARGVANVVARI